MRLIWSCLLALSIAGGLAAQEITGSIVGTATDPTGAGIPNAKVIITNTDHNAVVRETTTDANGNYSVPLLPAGHYSVTVGAQGFKKTVQSGIELNANR
jgi:hypothetical protein